MTANAQTTARPHVVIVGSGPIGAAYARTVLEARTDVRVTMIEAGPQLTDVPGQSVRNISDPHARDRARTLSQGPQAGELRREIGIPEDAVMEGSFTARHGTHLLDFGGAGSAHAPSFPAAAAATNVGGQGAHWTCAIPRPADGERVDFYSDEVWEELIGRAEELLHADHHAFEESLAGTAIRRVLQEEFGDELPADRGPGLLPVAGDRQEDGTMRWAGADTVLGPVLDDSSLRDRFTLHDLTLARHIEHAAEMVTGVRVEDLRTGEERTVAADAVVVAADAFRSPQLLFASGIRPWALGRHLTEHPMVISTVALDGSRLMRHVDESELESELQSRMQGAADPVAAVNRIPYSEPDHPYSAQVMFSAEPPMPLPDGHPRASNRWGYVNMGYGLRKRPRPEDRVTFDPVDRDYRGMPAMTIDYALTDEEHVEIERAARRLRRAGEALGEFVAEPRLLPPGSSLHYQGTMRLGQEDDGASVADPTSRVWGMENLWVGGNGVIPTANTMNPTLMAMALAVHGARTLAASLERLRHRAGTAIVDKR